MSDKPKTYTDQDAREIQDQMDKILDEHIKPNMPKVPLMLFAMLPIEDQGTKSTAIVAVASGPPPRMIVDLHRWATAALHLLQSQQADANATKH